MASGAWTASVVVLLVLLGGVGAARGQDGPRIITIVNADSVAGTLEDGQRIRTLIGNVHLRQDSTDLRARRATQFLDRDEILFEGTVEIASPSDTLNARQVTYTSATRVGRAEGAVRLADDEAEVFSNSATFYRAQSRAEFTEPVRLTERGGDAVLTSARGTYRTDHKEALFEGDVELVDSVTVLTSERGRYGTEDHRADFTGRVRLRHPSTRVDADTLTHFRDTEVSLARGNVIVERFGGEEAEGVASDTTQRTLLFGGRAFHDERARFSRVDIEPLLVRLRTDSTGATDTLLVRARVLEASQPDSIEASPGTISPPLDTRVSSPDSLTASPDSLVASPGALAAPSDSSSSPPDSLAEVRPIVQSVAAQPVVGKLQRVVARRDVRLYGAQLAAVADSAVFDRHTPEESDADSVRAPLRDEVRLFRDPVGWLSARGSAVVTEISGEVIRVIARDEAVDSVRAEGRAFAARRDSTLDRIDQIRGRQMLALFSGDSLRSLRVWPNAEAVYFRADDEGMLDGALRFSADSLAFSFDGDALRRVGGVRGIEGTYYDAGIIPEPLRLDGFRYTPERRPTRAALVAGTPLAPDSDEEPAPLALRAAPETVPSAGFTWVVASAEDRAEAERVAETYREQGREASIIPVEADGETVYRVGIGTYDEPDAAERERGDLPSEAWLLELTAPVSGGEAEE